MKRPDPLTPGARGSAAKRALARLLPYRLERAIALALDSGGERTLAGRDRFFREAGKHTGLIGCSGEHADYVLSTRDMSAGRRTFIHRRYGDDEQMELALRALESIGRAPDPGSLFIDVGAHVGTTTLCALRRHGFGSALAFEPAPTNHRLLRANVALNGIEESVRTRQAAVSERGGRARLHVSADLHGTHRLADDGELDVEAIALDDLVRSGEIDPSAAGLLWIDVEGHELEVLRGASLLLDRRVPLVVEWRRGGNPALAELLGEHYETAFDLTGSPYSFNVRSKLPAPLPANRLAALDPKRDTNLMVA